MTLNFKLGRAFCPGGTLLGVPSCSSEQGTPNKVSPGGAK